MMRKAYFETNAVNRVFDGSLSGTELRDRLAAVMVTPVVGMHTICELARGFLYSEHADAAARKFQIIRDLEPVFSEEARILLKQELARLRSGSAILPFMDSSRREKTKREVERLASGYFSEEARRGIEERICAVISATVRPDSGLQE